MADESNVYAMIAMVNANVNAARDEILNALENHEREEMKEISEIRSDIESLKAWRWRFIAVLAVIIALGIAQMPKSIELIGGL